MLSAHQEKCDNCIRPLRDGIPYPVKEGFLYFFSFFFKPFFFFFFVLEPRASSRHLRSDWSAEGHVTNQVAATAEEGINTRWLLI